MIVHLCMYINFLVKVFFHKLWITIYVCIFSHRKMFVCFDRIFNTYEVGISQPYYRLLILFSLYAWSASFFYRLFTIIYLFIICHWNQTYERIENTVDMKSNNATAKVDAEWLFYASYKYKCANTHVNFLWPRINGKEKNVCNFFSRIL